MKISFELNVKIAGESLQEVDDGLIQAAGARLKARIMAKAQEETPSMNKKDPPPGGLTFMKVDS